MNEPIEINDLVSISQAAKLIRSCRMTIYRLIERGHLEKPTEVAGHPMLPRSAVLEAKKYVKRRKR